MVDRGFFPISFNHALAASDLGLAIGHCRGDRYIGHSDRNGHRICARNNRRGDRSSNPSPKLPTLPAS